MILEAVAAPIFSRLAGESATPDGSIAAVAERPFAGREGWTWFVPAEVRYEGGRVLASPFVLRSANASLLARAHGYVVIGPDNARTDAGETVTVRRFSGGGRSG